MKLKHKVPERQLADFFASLQQYAVMRNFDVVEHFYGGGDCDLLVRSISETEILLTKFLGAPVRVARRSYVKSYYYPWGHIDLTDHYYWRGFCLMTGQEILDAAIDYRSYKIVSPYHEAAMLLLSSLLWGGFVKTRYNGRILAVYNSYPDQLHGALTKMLGLKAATYICDHIRCEDWDALEDHVEYLRNQVRKHYYSQNFFRSAMGQLDFVAHEIRLRLYGRVPFLQLVIPDVLTEGQKNLIEQVAEFRQYKASIVLCYDKSQVGLLESLKYISFQVRNGLVIFVSLEEGKEFKGAITISVDSVDEYSLNAIIDEFQGVSK